MGERLMTFGTIQASLFVVSYRQAWSCQETYVIELTIIVLTMIILIGAVIVEELRNHFPQQSQEPDSTLISKPPSKPSGGRSPE